MSGGSFDYLYYEVGKVTHQIAEMAEWTEEQGYPETTDELLDLLEELEDKKDLVKEVEWVASGDYSSDRLD